MVSSLSNYNLKDVKHNKSLKMFRNKLIVIAFIIVGLSGLGNCRTSRTIPDYLRNCYRNGSVSIQPPHNVQLLIELLNKIEQTDANYNVRIVSLALLHSLKIDGIERANNMKETEFVLPYRASAFQYSKYSFLLDLLIPGQNLPDIKQGLTETELCTLHILLSSTVTSRERGDEGKVCPIPGPNQRAPEHPHNGRQVPSYLPRQNRTNVPSSQSRCPIENGVVQTTWGDISPGTVIAGISAALEPQNVQIQDIYRAEESIKSDEMINNLISHTEDIDEIKIEWKKSLTTSENVISNVLAATLSGDIAEMVIRQGPLVNSTWTDYHIGGKGKWNDTVLPRFLYLTDPNEGQWEITDAEILGGIDGLIIANHVKEWTTTLNRLRLSQILEMYYSSYGVAFNHAVRACNRKQNIQKILATSDIHQQTLNLVNMLWFRLGTVYVSPMQVENMSKGAVQTFDNYWPKLVDAQPSCDVRGDTCPMDAILVTDGTWTKYQTEQLVSILSETLDVSSHGSSLGLIHGGTGEWLAKPSNSILSIFGDIANYTTEWTTRLNLPNVLTTVITHLEYKTQLENEKYTIAGLPNVVIIAAPTTRLSQAELTRSRTIIESLRVTYTDVYFLYIMPDEEGFKHLSIDSKQYSDMHVLSSETNVKNVAELIRVNFVERTIPKKLIPPSCDSPVPTDRRIQYEDYINVGQKIMYRIHPTYFMYASYIKVEFQGADQGELAICLSRKYSEDAVTSCKLVSGLSDAIFLIKHPCNGAPFCDPVYFIVKARQTYNKCGDKDCRYPDQIRFYVRHERLQCKGKPNNGNSLKNNILQQMSIILCFSILLLFSM